MTQVLQVAKIPPARKAVLRKSVDPESLFLVPRALLSGGKRELGAATSAWEDGIDVPVPWTDAAVLAVGVRWDGRTVVETKRSVEEVDRHLPRVVLPESGHAAPVLPQVLPNGLAVQVRATAPVRLD